MAKIVVPLFHIMVFFRTQKTGQFLSLVLDFIKFSLHNYGVLTLQEREEREKKE